MGGKFPRHRHFEIDLVCLNIHTLQFSTNVMEMDDKLIDDLLIKTQRLKNVTENIVKFFSNTDRADSDFEKTFLSDMCGALAVTMNETMTTMYDKACRVETLISELPSLYAIDELMLPICGYYCEIPCNHAFPNLILEEHHLCFSSEVRRNKQGNVSSNLYVEVSNSAIHKIAGSLVTGRSLQNGKNGKKCHWQERPSDTIPLFTASQIFRNCTSQIREWLGSVRPAAL